MRNGWLEYPYAGMKSVDGLDVLGYGSHPRVEGVPRRRAKGLSPEGTDQYWNELHIKVQGEAVEGELNGKPVCNATLPASKVHSGLFGLQFHTGKVQFRNVRIR